MEGRIELGVHTDVTGEYKLMWNVNAESIEVHHFNYETEEWEIVEEMSGSFLCYRMVEQLEPVLPGYEEEHYENIKDATKNVS